MLTLKSWESSVWHQAQNQSSKSIPTKSQNWTVKLKNFSKKNSQASKTFIPTDQAQKVGPFLQRFQLSSNQMKTHPQ